VFYENKNKYVDAVQMSQNKLLDAAKPVIQNVQLLICVVHGAARVATVVTSTHCIPVCKSLPIAL